MLIYLKTNYILRKSLILSAIFCFISISLFSQNSVVAVDDFYSTSINTALTMNPLENDFDPNGDGLFLYTVSDFTDFGTLSLNSDFTINYTPDLDFCGEDQYTYVISDINASLDTGIVTIIVTCPGGTNNPPNAGQDIDFCALPIVTNTVCISPTDPDGDAVSICAFDVLFECTVEIFNDTCIQFAALPGTAGINELQIIVCDDGNPLATDTMSYFINLDCTSPSLEDDVIIISNDAATMNGAPISLSQNSILFDALLNDSEICDYDLELSFVANGPFQGDAIVTSNMIEYTFDDGYSGTDQFQYFACNECGECSFATVLINVLPPCIADYNYCVEENSTSTICLDLCESEFEIVDLQSPLGSTISVLNDSCFSYTSLTEDIEILTLNALDALGNNFSEALNINIQSSCSQINAVNDTVFVSPGVPTIIDVLANDNNVAGNLPQIVNTSSNGTVTVNLDGTITFTPNVGFTGLETIEYELCDDSGNCSLATLVIVVLTNQAPIAQDDSAFTSVDTPVQISVLINDSDPEGDALSLNSISMPGNGTAILFSDEIIYTPAIGFTGIDFMNYEVCDINDNCDQGYVLIIVEAELVNLPPEFSDSAVSLSGIYNDTLSYCYSSSDPEGGEVTYSFVADPEFGAYSIDTANSCINYYVESLLGGTDSIEIVACDADQNCSSLFVIVETLIVMDNLEAVDDVLYFDYEDSIQIDILSNDIFGEDYDLELIGGVSSGNLEHQGDFLVYTPFDNLNSVDTFSYVLCDSNEVCDTASVIFLIGPLVAINDTVHIYSDDPIEISALDNDINQIPITLSDVSMPMNGISSYNMNTAVISYEPSAELDDVISYTITDQISSELSATADIIIINHKSEIDCADQANSFSPNGDGVNESYVISNAGQCFPESTLYVFNRWGELVHRAEIDNISKTWNGEEMETGEPVSAGTYYMIIENDTEILYSGFLQLIK